MAHNWGDFHVRLSAKFSTESAMTEEKELSFCLTPSLGNALVSKSVCIYSHSYRYILVYKWDAYLRHGDE